MKIIGFTRVRNKKEISEFRSLTGISNPVVEIGTQFCGSNRLEYHQMLDNLAADILVISSFENVVDTVSELRHLLVTLQERGTKLRVLERPEFDIERSLETIPFIDTFIKFKEESRRVIAKKIGRPARKYPEGFYCLYQKYRSKEITPNEAVSQLGLSRSKFSEFVRLFEH